LPNVERRRARFRLRRDLLGRLDEWQKVGTWEKLYALLPGQARSGRDGTRLPLLLVDVSRSRNSAALAGLRRAIRDPYRDTDRTHMGLRKRGPR